LFLVAVIKAVDEYQDLLRVSVASAANDHRLGANEAPPAIVSNFLGEELTEIIEAIETGKAYKNKEKLDMQIGVSVLPHFPKDTTDRNRTSPFAFTGNKFEFRMLGSSFSIGGPNIVLNTIIAETLRQFADSLEKSNNFKGDLAALIKKTISEHKRIVFNGNNYAEEWVVEAKKRGLSNLKTTVDALPEFISKKSVELFTKHHVFSETELHSRYEILMEAYCKTINIEALTMVDMVKRDIIPACIDYQKDLTQLHMQKVKLGFYDDSLEKHLITNISKACASLLRKLETLENVIHETKEGDILAHARFFREKVFAAMVELRLDVDELETLVANKYWPFPSYGQILFSVI
jgi:glutamine synthetase